MGKTINTILNLTDKFTPKLTKAREEALVFKQKLKNCNAAAVDIDKGLSAGIFASKHKSKQKRPFNEVVEKSFSTTYSPKQRWQQVRQEWRR